MHRRKTESTFSTQASNYCTNSIGFNSIYTSNFNSNINSNISDKSYITRKQMSFRSQKNKKIKK